ncbi:hypothetical protein [Oleiharenicola sp. Vm1]|uniref:hypothetical protein n=1 Tax=Oleiharenicola sp. Vm1 TaxID=3398393 RepID=UPI0039F541BC
MKTRLMIIGCGLIAGLVLALTWVSLRAEMRALVSERENFAQSDRALVKEHASFQRRVVEVQGDLAERKRVMLATQSAADRARANIGSYVARLKAEHAGRAPVVRPPPPPTVTGGGAYFPELMSDPEYNALYAQSVRLSLKSYQGGALRKLGLPDDVMEKAIDLLAEEQASLMDLHNLAGSNPLQPSNSKEIQQMRKQLAQETQAQLKTLLGEEGYARYKDETEGSAAQRQYATQPLERRLSYSEEPLSAEQKARLDAYEAAQDYGSRAFFQKQAQIYREARRTGTIPVDEARVAFYRSVLTPAQMAAVEELHREAEASLKRSLLPRSEGK